MARLFLEMDGVLTDFDGQFERWFGKKVRVWLYKTDPGVRKPIDDHLVLASEEFWTEMVPRSPITLSAPHYAPNCSLGKGKWVQANLDSAKGAHGRSDDLLVDDSPANSQGWAGRFLLHRDWEETRGQIGFFPYLCEYQI